MRSATALALVLGCANVAGPAPPPGIRLWESHDGTSITEGETTLDVDPDTAYATVIDYPRWSSLFPDIARVEITKQDGVDARVTLVRQDGNHHNVHFHNRPQLRTVWFEDTGGRAEVWAEIVFAPGERPSTTRVHSRLFANVHGVASLVVSDARLRSLRQRRITSDLSQLQTYFLHVARQR